MKFTNAKEEKCCTFDTVCFGEYFRFGENFYIKAEVDDEDGDYYAINLETGEGTTLPSGTVVELIEIKEIIYENF